MLIENRNNEIHITVSSDIDEFGLNRIIEYLKCLEIATKSKGKQSDINKLTNEVNSIIL